MKPDEKLRSAILSALDGTAMLFIGAGFSRGATNISGQPLPLASELATLLGKDVGQPDVRSLPLAAQMVLDNNNLGVPHLRSVLRKQFTVSKCTVEQASIARLPWRRVYTTNYDNVIEEAVSYPQRYSSVTIRTRPRDIDFSNPVCVHLHGYVGFVDQEHELREFVLTKNDYISEKIRESGWLNSLLTDIETSQHVIFVGYSLSDLDIARVLYAKEAWQRKTIFIVGPSASLEDEYNLKGFGSVFKIGVSGFTSILDKEKREYEPRVTSPRFVSFARVERPDKVPNRVTDDQRYNLLIKGVVDLAALASQSAHADGNEYLAQRVQTQQIRRLIDAGSKDIVLHSGLGNGKSVICDELSYDLVGRGIGYYKLMREHSGVHRELEAICADHNKHVIEIENYTRHFELIRKIQHIRNDRTICIYSARSALHDTAFGKLHDIVGDEHVQVIDANLLSDRELEQLHRIIETTGVWDGTASDLKRRSVEQMRGRLGGQMSSILFDLLRSPSIEARVKKEWADVVGQSPIWRACVGACILESLGYDENLDMLFEIGFLKPEKYKEIQTSAPVRELFKLERGSLCLRSPVLAKFLVSSIEDRNSLVDLLVEMAEVASACSDDDERSKYLFQDLMLFANVVGFFPANEQHELLVEYFERIKNYTTRWQKPFYWLQYSIARFAAKDLEKSWRYVKNARAKAAELPGFRDFHIANHEARLWLEDGIESTDPKVAFERFGQAHRILREQIADRDTKFYPYGVARFYQQYFGKFSHQWTGAQCGAFERACEEILRAISKLPLYLRGDHRVRECENSLRQIAKKA